MKRIEIIVGDITTLAVDCIVNSAKNSLTGGGGVDGAIHRAAGRKLLRHCMLLPAAETGDAVLTPGFKLPAKAIIHVVGPKWKDGLSDEEAVLAACYRHALDIAEKEAFGTIAFPCVSTGKFRFPKALAAEIALRECANHPYEGKIAICCFTEEDAAIYRKMLEGQMP